MLNNFLSEFLTAILSKDPRQYWLVHIHKSSGINNLHFNDWLFKIQA